MPDKIETVKEWMSLCGSKVMHFHLFMLTPILWPPILRSNRIPIVFWLARLKF